MSVTITHIVLFQAKPDTKPEDVHAACKRFLDLKYKCIHPTTKAPYILSVKGGANNSPEGHAGGLTHGFVVEFASEKDRDYYVKEDPAHREFVQGFGPLLEKLTVFDFASSKF